MTISDDDFLKILSTWDGEQEMPAQCILKSGSNSIIFRIKKSHGPQLEVQQLSNHGMNQNTWQINTSVEGLLALRDFFQQASEQKFKPPCVECYDFFKIFPEPEACKNKSEPPFDVWFESDEEEF